MAFLSRLWGVRHLRYWYLRVCLAIWWFNVGQYLGAFPNQSDWDYLDAVWRGEA